MRDVAVGGLTRPCSLPHDRESARRRRHTRTMYFYDARLAPFLSRCALRSFSMPPTARAHFYIFHAPSSLPCQRAWVARRDDAAGTPPAGRASARAGRCCYRRFYEGRYLYATLITLFSLRRYAAFESGILSRFLATRLSFSASAAFFTTPCRHDDERHDRLILPMRRHLVGPPDFAYRRMPPTISTLSEAYLSAIPYE